MPTVKSHAASSPSESESQGPYLELDFTSPGAGARLCRTVFRAKDGKRQVATTSDLGRWDDSLRALCIGLIKAKVLLESETTPEAGRRCIQSTTKAGSWVVSLKNGMEKDGGWRKSVFGDQRTALSVINVEGGKTDKSRVEPTKNVEGGKTDEPTKRELPKQAEVFYNVTNLPLGGLHVKVTNDDTDEEITDRQKLWKLAWNLERQSNRWEESHLLSETTPPVPPPSPPAQESGGSRAPEVKLSDADLQRHAVIQPGKRNFFDICRRVALREKRATLPDEAQFNQLFPQENPFAQRTVAEGHMEIVRWVKKHGRIAGQRQPGRRALAELDGLFAKYGKTETTTIAEADRKLSPRLLYDLVWELSSKSQPSLDRGYRSFSLPAAEDFIAIQVPLLELIDPTPDVPLSLHAFRGWLIIERVPVPKRDDGRRQLWPGGNVCPAPAFAILDQDEAWRTALKSAETFVRSLVSEGSWPTDCDFRWSLARTDGEGRPLSGPRALRSPQPRLGRITAPDTARRNVLPPMLLGGHIGAAFALGLAHLCHLPGVGNLSFDGVCVMAGIQPNGDLLPCEADRARLLLEAVYGTAIPATVAVVTGPLAQTSIPPGPHECHVLEASNLSDAAGKLAKDLQRYAEIKADLPPAVEGFQPRPEIDRLLSVPFASDGPASGSMVIVAPAGTGKTTWLAGEIRRRRADLTAPIFHFIPNRSSAMRANIARSLAEQLCRKYRLAVPNEIRGQPEEALKKLLHDVSEMRPRTSNGRIIPEILFVEAADQVREAESLLAGLVEPELKPGIWCVFTTRPKGDRWRNTNEKVQLYDFVTGQRLDPDDPRVVADTEPGGNARSTYLRAVENYIRWANGEYALGLSDQLVRAICGGSAIPVFLTVTERIEQLQRLRPCGAGELPRLRRDATLWLLKADERAQELADALTVFAVKRWARDVGENIANHRPWQILGLLLLAEATVSCADVDRWVSETEVTGAFSDLADFKEFCRRHSATVLREALNFFETRPLHGDDERPYQFRHPSYERLVRDRLGEGVWRRECAAFLALVGLCRSRKRRQLPADPPHHEGWTLRHLPRFLREAERWNELIELLCNPTFPLAKSGAGMPAELVVDYSETVRLLPGSVSASLDLRQSLAELIRNEVLGPVERAAAGRLLGRLGDPRPGVGVEEKDGILVPKIEWTDPIFGEFIMGSNESQYAEEKPEFPCPLNEEDSFRISKYPITVAQYQCFVDDEGYQDERDFDDDGYWTEEGLAWRRRENVTRPMDDENPVFQTRNHPRVHVSWYEAIAFTRWLSKKLGIEVTLPTEIQWERVARHTNGLKYPWVKMVDGKQDLKSAEDDLEKRCNFWETGIGHTCAVGIFPSGRSVCGAEDMAGNTWEWTRTKWTPDYQDYLKCVDNDLKGDAALVLRGAAWIISRDYLPSWYRYDCDPVNRNDYIGFRVVWVGASARKVASV